LSNQFAYAEQVRNGKVPLQVGRPLTAHEQRVRFAIFGLRCGISDEDFSTTFPKTEAIAVLDYFPLLAHLCEQGMINRDSSGKYRLSPVGLLFANEIGLILSIT
jgi:coproporphyrinogen III oxidase-like Fe-S oxidoreductase